MEKYAKIWSRDYTVHYDELLLQIILKKSGELNLPVFFFTFDQGLSVAATTAKLKDKLFRGLDKKYLKNQKKFQIFKNEFYASSRNYLRVSQSYDREKLKEFSQAKIISLLERYYQSWLVYTKYLFWLFTLSESQAKKTNDFIEKQAAELKKQGQLPAYLTLVNRPSQKSSIFLLEEEILRYKKNRRRINFAKLFEKYRWLPFGDLNGLEWNLSGFKKYLTDLKPSKGKLISFAWLKQDLKINPAEAEMIRINQEVAYLRDFRDEVRRQGVYAVHFLYQEIARRLKIRYQDLLLFSTPETIEFLRGRPVTTKEISRRKKPGALVLKNNKFLFITGPKGRRYFNLLKEKNLSRISGMTAYAGRISGRVKVIKLDKEVKKVKKGDIMVTVTTHPDYLPKMRIARAIVTDEGGMTCHAAIVARELKIPCVVGTKIATEALKDGDLVEVDANRGIVRKL